MKRKLCEWADDIATMACLLFMFVSFYIFGAAVTLVVYQ